MAAAFLMGGYMIWEARQLEVNSLEIPLRKLPAAMDGFSIVHLSDVHFGMIHGNGRLQEMVERVNALGPDMVAITGDLVDEAVVHLEEMAEPLSKIQSRWGSLP
jgi:predicted MPP superfamily phosphohydrolase